MEIKFEGFGKIPRLSRDCVITEKIDGTNAQVYILPVDDNVNLFDSFRAKGWEVIKNGDFHYGVIPASRNKHITINKDNYGFANWVKDNAQELLKLGVGRHFGEWWGKGIQRGYEAEGKTFSLFNVNRWSNDDIRPKCCSVVPTLYEGMFDTNQIQYVIKKLELNGSVCSSGFMQPEGIMIYHTASGKIFKKTIKDDASPKSLVEESK